MSVLTRLVVVLVFCVSILVAGCEGGCSPGTQSSRALSAEGNGSCSQSGCHSQIEVISTSHDCVSCHGGDDTAPGKEGAHPMYTSVLNNWFAPEFPMRNKGWNSTGKFDESFSVNGLSELRFKNPGDLHVVDQTCGAAGCHEDIVRRVKLNIHAGMQGDLSQIMFLNGDTLQPDNKSRWAGYDSFNPDYDAGITGTIQSLRMIPPVECLKRDDPRLAVNNPDLQLYPNPILSQPCPVRQPDCCPDGFSFVGTPQTKVGQMNEGEVVSRMYSNNDCARCHLWNDGSKRTGDMRAAGCTACHVKYANNGLSRSADESIDKSLISRPAKHTFKGATDDDQCAHCHNRGGRIPQSYYGRRERASGGRESPKNPVNASYTDLSLLGDGPFSSLHGRTFPFYIDDEDTTNNYDETPADVHQKKYGMQCVDCHIETEVHGDGHIYEDRFYEVEIKCRTCHGTRNAIANGNTLKKVAGTTVFRKHPRLSIENGQVFLQLKSSSQRLKVTQIKAAVDSRKQVSLDGHRRRHMEKLECFSCHVTWYQNCFSCHVERDDSGPERNWSDGKVRIGKLTKDNRKFVSIDTFVLGSNRNAQYLPEGKLAPFIGFGTFNTYKNGIRLVYEDRVPVASDGVSKGIPWNKIHPHSNQIKPRNCNECHPTDAVFLDYTQQEIDAVYNVGDPKGALNNNGILKDVDCDNQPDKTYQKRCKRLARLRVTYGLGSTRYRQDAFVADPKGGKDIQIEYVLDRFVGDELYDINCPDGDKKNPDITAPACLGPNPVSHNGFRALTVDEINAMFRIIINQRTMDRHTRSVEFPDKPALGVLK
ncbi:hypothetical protein MNBD_GAMMA09-2440 [hydrothermal vent metagenome]|uniref:Cytochrome c family protein n=1 Tax=hydrothermal vent metagenome TaxID=652676 RepID=A0A3B0YPC3_9ZZZZ